MADAVASPLLRMLSGRLDSLIDNGLDIADAAIESSRLVRMLPQSLRRWIDRSWILKDFQLTLAELQALVLQAENRSEDDSALLYWLSMVKDAVYEANDILDEFMFSKSHKPFQYALLLEMENSFGRLRKLIRRRTMMPLPTATPPAATSKSALASSARILQTSPWKTETTVLGLETDLDMLLRELLFKWSLKVIPIVGMAGLGKTMLAQLVYNRPEVSGHFDTKQWIHVGQYFDAEMIVRELFGDTDRFLERLVIGRRILIVLDDVWDEDIEKLNKFISLLQWAAPGSAVVVTTRSERVAMVLGTVEWHSPKLLSDDHSWSLFEREAFLSAEDVTKEPEQQFHRRLVAKCKGLPLAIKTLGMEMRQRRGQQPRWLLGKNDDMWNLPGFACSVLPSLKRSYDNLPSHLKQCFAFCSIFPKGYAIGKDQLAQLWIAQGFVPLRDAGTSPETIGNYYFMELLHASFFVEVIRDNRGEIVKCRMHDLIHDLAQSVARLGCKIVEKSSLLPSVAAHVRYCSLVWNGDLAKSTISELLHRPKRLRTLLLFSSNLRKIPGFLFKLRYLHSLDLSGSGTQTLSESIGDMIHLRYLNLSRTQIKSLPSSLWRLRSLYTLELVECFRLLKLPNSICKLINLRHLDIQSCFSLSHMPPHISTLRHLQKLPLFILSNIDGCSHIDELRELDLRGELEIKNLEYISRPEDAHNVKLFEKQDLRTLKLSWNDHHQGKSREVLENLKPPRELSWIDHHQDKSREVLENLKPPRELKVLHITGYGGIQYPSWLSSFLQNLVSLSLTDSSCRVVPPLGQLQNLEDLYIKGMLALEIIDSKFYGADGGVKGFPSLKCLELYDMPQLADWRSFYLEEKEAAAFPCLKSLTISGCRNLDKIPVIPNLEKLALGDCNGRLLLSLEHQTSLFSLVISDYKDILPRPLGDLYSIRELTLYRCDRLLSEFYSDMKCFSSLQHLRILYCKGLASLPTGLRDLASLQRLEIVGCLKLLYVPDIFEDLSALNELVIDSCPMLATLPSSISRTQLGKLVIQGCPILSRQLDGKEWSKIAHIPSIEMDTEDQASKE